MYIKRVTLFKLVTPEIRISMEIYFNEKEELIFDGYDIGKTVEECWGDSDYEYNYTVKKDEVKKLYKILGIKESDKKSLLLEIKKRFEGNKAYSEFGEFMDKNNIDYKSFTWT